MIEALSNGFQTALLWLCAVAIVVVSCLAIAINFRRLMKAARPRLKGATAAVFIGFCIVAILYGGRKGTITYPYTDYEMRYLVNNGSYVSNDFVHVDFTRVVVPATAPFFLTYRQVDSTNDEDWVVHISTTFAEFACPSNVPFAAATNYDWIAYTTWTPGPTVQTNGVWHSYWGKDKRLHTHFIPIRSAVRLDGEVIATPKSKREASDED